MYTHRDMFDEPMSVGDIVIYTAAGAGRSVPALALGEIKSFTKSGVTLWNLDSNLDRQRRTEYRRVLNGKTYTYPDGRVHEYYDLVDTGRTEEKEPVNVVMKPGRFYIFRKI